MWDKENYFPGLCSPIFTPVVSIKSSFQFAVACPTHFSPANEMEYSPAFKYEASSIFLTQWQFFFVTLTPKVIVLVSASVLHILMPLLSDL